MTIVSSPALAATQPYFTFSTVTNPAVAGGSKLFNAIFEVGSGGSLALDTAAGEAATYGGSAITVTSFSGTSAGNDIMSMSINFTVGGTAYRMSNNGIDILPGSDNSVVTWTGPTRTPLGGTSVATLAYYAAAAPEIDGGLLPGVTLLFGVFALWVLKRRSRSDIRSSPNHLPFPA